MTIEKMKIKKACGIDGIAIEVWLFAREGVKKILLELMTKADQKGRRKHSRGLEKEYLSSRV